MEAKEVRDRIQENINSHMDYLTNKEAPVDSSSLLLPTPDPINDYQTAKHKVAYRQFETELDPIIQDQLKRQQQKCKILEERLRNKQTFITQLKEFQAELTHAFDQSQAELNLTKTRNEDLRMEIARLMQTNEELEKLVVHMEYIHLAKFEKSPSPPSPSKANRKQKDRSYQQQPLSRNQEQRSYSHRQLPSLGLYQIPKQTVDIAQAVGCQAEQISKQCKSIGKFLHYLLEMVVACSPQIKNISCLKEKLKYCWKWLKSIVKESAQIRDYGDQTKAERQKLQRLLKAASPNEIFSEVQRLHIQNKQYIHVIQLAMDFHRMPEECTAKQLQLFFRQRLQRR